MNPREKFVAALRAEWNALPLLFNSTKSDYSAMADLAYRAIEAILADGDEAARPVAAGEAVRCAGCDHVTELQHVCENCGDRVSAAPTGDRP